MEKTEKTAEKAMFDKYVDMVRRRAHNFADRWCVEYEEMEAQGFLIYCECLNKFNPEKAGFSTYLYIQLNRLRDFARTWVRTKGYLMQDYFSRRNGNGEIDYEDCVEARKEEVRLEELVDSAGGELSPGAFEVFKWIVTREFETARVKNPTPKIAAREFKKKLEEMEEIWDECGRWWNEKGIAIYA